MSKGVASYFLLVYGLLDVPLSTIARFEQKGLIAFEALIKLAMALGYSSEIKNLFSAPKFDTIEETCNVLTPPFLPRRIEYHNIGLSFVFKTIHH